MRSGLVAALLLAGGCSPPAANTAPGWRAQFTVDPAIRPGDEAYVCHSFAVAVAGADGIHVGRVTWRPPEGPVVLHHASLFAAAGSPAIGEVPCDPMPERVAALGVWTPGVEPLQLPDGVAIALPPGTTRLLVLAHVLRASEGAGRPTEVELQAAPAPAQHLVNWVDVFAPVPVLFPHESARSVGRCRFEQPVHLVTDWPHMHRHGTAFRGTVVRADGRREPLLELSSWSFEHQLIYPLDVQLEPGDSVETECAWSNPTDEQILPGPYSGNEMCNQGLFLWPFDHARCAP